MKRTISLLLTVLMVVSILSLNTFADYSSSDDEGRGVIRNYWDAYLAYSVRNTNMLTGGMFANISNYLSAALSPNVCSQSPNGYHNCANYDSVTHDNTGYYISCTCEYCNEQYVIRTKDMFKVYGQYVYNELPLIKMKSNGTFVWHPHIKDLTGTARLDALEQSYSLLADGNGYSYNAERLEVKSIESDGIYNDFVRVTVLYPVQTISHVGLYDIQVVAPITGSYKRLNTVSAMGSYNSGGAGEDTDVFKTWSEGNYTTKTSGEVINVGYATSGTITIIHGQINLILPDYEITMTQIDDNYSVNYRPTNIITNYYVKNENNQYTQNTNPIFNENTGVFYNPVTNESTTINEWEYSYNGNCYYLKDGNNNQIVVDYTLDNIVIEQGGNEYTLYYGDMSETEEETNNNGSGNGNGESGGGTSTDTGIFGQIGTLLGTLISGLLAGITALLSAILGALTSLVETIGDGFANIVQAILGWFAELPALFSGFLEFLGAVFSFLPSQIISMLSFGVAAVVFIGIIKAIRR